MRALRTSLLEIRLISPRVLASTSARVRSTLAAPSTGAFPAAPARAPMLTTADFRPEASLAVLKRSSSSETGPPAS